MEIFIGKKKTFFSSRAALKKGTLLITSKVPRKKKCFTQKIMTQQMKTVSLI